MNNQLISAYEQHNSSEKLPGIDKLPKLEESSTSSTSFNDSNQQNMPSTSNTYLPPPSNSAYSFNAIQHHLYQNISPPLTPAVSPSSVLLDPMQFKRKFSVDVGPFGFGSNIPHQTPMIDQDAFRRSSCSAMSMDDSNAYNNPTMNSRCSQSNDFYMNTNSMQQPFDNRPAQSPTTETAPSKRRGSRAHLNGPSTQHKHRCKYTYCTWSFKRYEHLKRHMLVHTGKRPHVCQFPGCGKSFSRSDNFHAHYRTHTKKLQQQQNGTKKPTPSTAAAAAVAATAAAAVTSVGTTGPSMTTPQVFDERSPSYFAKQPFDIAYQEMYGHHHHHHHHHHHRPSFSAEENTNYNHSLRNFNQSGFGMHSSHVPSLLNHEVHNQSFFDSNEPDRNNAFGYPMNTLVTSESPSSSYRDPYGFPNYTMATMTTSNTLSASPVTQTMAPANEGAAGRRSSSANPDSQKAHICPISHCQRSFKRLEHLKRHMRIHTLERPFTCSFNNCHKTFSRSDNLSQHMKTHQRTEDRRRRQQPSQEFNPMIKQENSPSLSQSANDNSMLNTMVGISWHSANTGTVGC